MNLELHTSEQLPDYITTPSVVESFSQSQITTIQKKWIVLDDKEREICKNHLQAIEIWSDTNNKVYIKNIINQLLPLLKPEEQTLLPTILKNIRKESKDITTTQKDIASYINNLLWNAKTENNITGVKNNGFQPITSPDTISDEEKKRIEEKKSILEKKTAEIQTLTPEEQQNKEKNEQDLKMKQEAYNQLNKIYIDNSEKIQNIKFPEDFRLLSITDKLPPEKLQIFREAFGYIFENKPWEPIWANGQENNDVDNKIAKLIYYYAQLNDKITQSKTNPKIKVTPKEQLQAQEFTNTLTSFWINQEEFYTSLDIQYKESKEEKSNNNNKNRSYEFTTSESSTSKEEASTTKESTLDNLSGSFEKMNSDAMKVDPIFKDQFNKTKSWFDDKSLLQSFPLPKGKNMLDFDIKNPKLMGVIFSTLKDEKSHPLISSSIRNPEKILSAKKALIVRTLFEANPNLKELPLSIASKLYPPQPGKEQKIPSRRRKENIEKKLLIELMDYNFRTTQEQFITQEIKKWYITYFNRLLLATPALKDFEFKPEEIVLTNNQVKLPLYLKWEKQVNNYLFVEDGQIYITNSLYNPLNTNPNTISKWKMRIWSIDDFKQFSEQVTASIKPDIIKESVSDLNPRSTYNDKIQEVINRTIDENSKILSDTQAGIAHGLAWAKAQSSLFNLMQHRHQDGETQLSDTNTTIEANNPFYNILNNYTTDSTKSISKQDNINWFEWLYLSKNAVLQGSATENEVLSRDINKLENFLTDKKSNLKIDNYLTQKPTNEIEQYKYNILQTLQSKNRKQWESFALFLKLFGTHPEKWKENINSLDINKFHNFINQLDNVNDLSLLNVDSLINKNNPVFATLDSTYSVSADDELLTNLDNISDDETIETIIT